MKRTIFFRRILSMAAVLMVPVERYGPVSATFEAPTAVTPSDLQAGSDRQSVAVWIWAVSAAVMLGAGRLIGRKKVRPSPGS